MADFDHSGNLRNALSNQFQPVETQRVMIDPSALPIGLIDIERDDSPVTTLVRELWPETGAHEAEPMDPAVQNCNYPPANAANEVTIESSNSLDPSTSDSANRLLEEGGCDAHPGADDVAAQHALTGALHDETPYPDEETGWIGTKAIPMPLSNNTLSRKHGRCGQGQQNT